MWISKAGNWWLWCLTLKQRDNLIYNFKIEFVNYRKRAAYPKDYRDKKRDHKNYEKLFFHNFSRTYLTALEKSLRPRASGILSILVHSGC